MSYENSAALRADPVFVGRVDACAVEQANVFKDDTRGDISALAGNILVTGQAGSLLPMVAVAPGFGDSPDQSTIDDGQILSAVQSVWPTVAALIFPQPTT